MKRDRRLTLSGRATVVWCLLGFAGLQLLGLALTGDCLPADRIDRPYGEKLALLEARRARDPGRPLVLMLGSSRIYNGVRPGLLSASDSATPGTPLLFNFGLTGQGALQELLCLRRLLARGVRPRLVFVEVVPSLLHHKTAAENLPVECLTWDDLAVLSRYAASPAALYWNWHLSRTAPWFTFRSSFLSRAERCGVLRGWEQRRAGGVDDLGWGEMLPPCDRAEYERDLARARADHSRGLQVVGVAPTTDRALRDLLALCRREGIEAALLVMPEAKVFQSWYAPAARAAGDAYLRGLSEEKGVALIDARDWVPDDEFRDGHHLLATGARTFTERFGREALSPLMARAGRHDPGTPATRRRLWRTDG